MKRIYFETVKKWAIGVGAGGATAAGLIFLYLAMIGAIDVLGFSGDSVCRGTVEDPCYAYINFTANEDIYIYPIDYDPWGRDTPFEFDPNVKEWKLQRSWGSGWRTINLSKTWSTKVKYAVKFSKGTTYNIRIEVLKHNEFESIKWTAFEVIDPVFLGSNYIEKDGKVKYEKVCNPVYKEYITVTKKTCENITEYSVIDNFPSNTTEKEKFGYYNYTLTTDYDCSETIIDTKMVDCIYTGEVIEIGEVNESIKLDNYACGVDEEGIICDAKRVGDDGADGNGDGICQAGEKCIRV